MQEEAFSELPFFFLPKDRYSKRDSKTLSQNIIPTIYSSKGPLIILKIIYSSLRLPLEKGMATHSSTLAWKTHGWRSLVAAVHGVAKSQTQLSDFTFIFHFHALEKEMATHSSVLAWRIPGTEEPGGRQSMG